MTHLISADVVEPVVRALRELGADVARVSTSKAAYGDPDRILDEAASQLGEAVGLRVAAELPPGALGPVDYALSTSATVREGLHRLSRYYGVATERVQVTVLESPRAGLELSRSPAVRHSRHWIEFSLALITARLRACAGARMKLDAVSFRHAAPASSSAHVAFFRAPVTFGAPADRLLFPVRVLDLPLRTSAPELAQMLESRLDVIDERANGDPIVRRARKLVLDALGRDAVTIDSVAARLAMSRRSLQRRLSERGVSFRDLVDDVRRARAQQLLEEQRLRTSEIAAALGFGDTGAFFRAFRRWTGVSPRSHDA